MSQSGALLVTPLGIFIHVFMHPSTFSTCLSILAIHLSFTNYQVPIAAETSWVWPRISSQEHFTSEASRRHFSQMPTPPPSFWCGLIYSEIIPDDWAPHLICVTARVNCDLNAPDNCCLLLNNKTKEICCAGMWTGFSCLSDSSLSRDMQTLPLYLHGANIQMLCGG